MKYLVKFKVCSIFVMSIKIKTVFHMQHKFNVKLLIYIIMRVNYKFQVQVRLDGFKYQLDKSIDIELSTFETFGDLPFFKTLLGKVLDIYSSYFNLPFKKLGIDLDFIDLNFLLFIRTIEMSNFDNIHFTDNYVTVCSLSGKGFEFSLNVLEL